MPRRVDTEGNVSDPNAKEQDESGRIGPIRIDIPLWKLGRISFESHSTTASLGVLALLLIVLLIPILALVQALPGQHPAIATIMDKLGQALCWSSGSFLAPQPVAMVGRFCAVCEPAQKVRSLNAYLCKAPLPTRNPLL